MEHRRLGETGIEVSRLALGCGNFGGVGSAPAFFGQGESEEEAFALMDAAAALGITLFDTADAYGGGRSERWIGRWLARQPAETRGRIVLSTKVFHSVEGDPADRGLAPDRIRRQIEGSLERLGVERVDLYVIHAPDPETPIADTLEALDGLVRAGKVCAVGASNVTAPELEQALAASEERGLVRFEWVQNSYSLLERGDEEDVLPLCAEHGLGYTPFGPLAGGWLTGKYRRGASYPEGSRMTLRPEPYERIENQRTFAGLEALEAAARERGTDMATLALAWVVHHPLVTSTILGPRRPAHLDPARGALDLALGEDERAELAAYFQG
ncbi:MAG TPA: aldo/keto reductase [Gaiellaceae bacterium]|nr:aldo/keto reductase [Gaiellaceae bacterium]